MNRPEPATLSAATEHFLRAYALATLTGVGVLTSARVADAQITTSTAAGQTINDPNGVIYLFANESGFGANSGPMLSVKELFYLSAHSYQRAAGVTNLSVRVTGSYFAANLASGTTVSANAGNFLTPGTFRIGDHVVSTSSNYFNQGAFRGQTGYLGFKFTDPVSGNTDYGWARISESNIQDSLTLIDAAYDISGAPIQTGQVPEPGSLGLLAGGAGCLALWRRRAARHRQAADAATGVGDTEAAPVA